MVDFADVLLESQLGGGGGDRMEIAAVHEAGLIVHQHRL